MLKKTSLSALVEERLMGLTFARAKIKLKAKRNRSEHASANQKYFLLYCLTLSRTTDLHKEMLPITQTQGRRRTSNKYFDFLGSELGLPAGRDQRRERVVQKEQLNFSDSHSKLLLTWG